MNGAASFQQAANLSTGWRVGAGLLDVSVNHAAQLDRLYRAAAQPGISAAKGDVDDPPARMAITCVLADNKT
jgi:hypothetical protein